MIMMRLQLLLSTLAFLLPRLVLTVTTDDITAASKPVDKTPSLSHSKLYKLNVNFWDTFLYSRDNVEAKSINSTIFATDVKGRIDATRNFEGRELNTEYLFGLFANLAAADVHALSLLGVPISYEIVKFTANDYITSASTIVMFNFTSLGTIITVEIDTWIAWNTNGDMTQYDGTFKYWQWLQDYVVSKAKPLLGASTATQAVGILTIVLANQICTTHQTYCNGTNTQYADFNTCYSYLTTKTRWGQAYEFGRDTLLCRMLHQNMIPFRPSVHCPHIGPSGGGMCTDDMTYISTVQQPYFILPWVTK